MTTISYDICNCCKERITPRLSQIEFEGIIYKINLMLAPTQRSSELPVEIVHICLNCINKIHNFQNLNMSSQITKG